MVYRSLLVLTALTLILSPVNSEAGFRGVSVSVNIGSHGGHGGGYGRCHSGCGRRGYAGYGGGRHSFVGVFAGGGRHYGQGRGHCRRGYRQSRSGRRCHKRSHCSRHGRGYFHARRYHGGQGWRV